MGYGSPDSLDAVEAFLARMRHGAPTSPAFVERIRDHYRDIGGRSPFNTITSAQAVALQALLDRECDAGEYRVLVGMKYGQPSIPDAVRALKGAGILQACAIALAPHFSRLSIGNYMRALEAARREEFPELAVVWVKQWHTHPHLIGCIRDQISDALAQWREAPRELTVVFTAHSLPEKIREWSDPYESQLRETARVVAEEAGIRQWMFSFQSAGSTSEPWLGPDIQENILKLHDKGVHNILVCPIGFVTDNLEILYDIDIACQQLATRLGMVLRRTHSRNTHPLFIRALGDLVRVQLSPYRS